MHRKLIEKLVGGDFVRMTSRRYLVGARMKDPNKIIECIEDKRKLTSVNSLFSKPPVFDGCSFFWPPTKMQ